MESTWPLGGHNPLKRVIKHCVCKHSRVRAGSTMTCTTCLKNAGTQPGSEPTPTHLTESSAQARRASVIYFIALGRHLGSCNLAQGFKRLKPKMKQSRQVKEPSGNQEEHLGQHISAKHKSFALINKK